MKHLDIALPKENYDFLLKPEVIRLTKALKRSTDARFFVDSNQELLVEIEDLCLLVQTEEELEILREIFIDGTYNFIYDRPFVIWDIGMNTGFVSLYLAKNERVRAAIGYEPFKMTYNQALRNLELNPKIASKVKAVNDGVSDREENLTIDYVYECKSSIGIDRMPEQYKNNDDKPAIAQEIHLLPAKDVLESIRSQYPDCDIVAKIDCEGSEYAILSSLYASGQLDRLKAVMIEWHEKGPDRLVEWLRQSGFAIFSRRPISKTIGMIYAVRV